MDKETLLKICDAVFEEGVDIGQEDADYGLFHFLSDVQKQAVKQSRIEKILNKFGVNVEGE